MNNRNRHMQYRKSIYRRRRVRAVIICTILIIAVAFALFMIIGTALHNKAQSSREPDPHGEETRETNQRPTQAASVGCYPLPLLEDGSSFSSRLSAIPDSAQAVCLSLNDKDGTLFFRSELASSLSQLSVHGDASALSNAVSSIDKNGYYISSVLHIPSFSQENDLLLDVKLSTWGAVTCEAIRAGVNDVLLIVKDMDVDHVDKLCKLADNVHSTVSNAIIGLSLSESVLEDEDSTAIIDKFSAHFNYLALDTTAIRSDEDAVSFIEGRISGLQLELMYYKMRVLLPDADDASVRDEYIEAVKKYNISSWQILP